MPPLRQQCPPHIHSSRRRLGVSRLIGFVESCGPFVERSMLPSRSLLLRFSVSCIVVAILGYGMMSMYWCCRLSFESVVVLCPGREKILGATACGSWQGAEVGRLRSSPSGPRDLSSCGSCGEGAICKGCRLNPRVHCFLHCVAAGAAAWRLNRLLFCVLAVKRS